MLTGMESGAGETTVAAKTLQDKTKRDEWSEGGVMSLLDEYEAKWVLRNRAKLKGTDWEEIARQVSVRYNGTKPGKSPIQCKNKIESMKKRYRGETSVINNNNSGSSWHFFSRMDSLLKGTTNCMQSKDNGNSENCLKMVNNDDHCEVKIVGNARNCERIDVEGENHNEGSNQDDGSNTVPDDGEFSTPKSKMVNLGDGSRKMNSFKRKKRLGSDVAESIRLLAHSMLKIEQSRIEMYRDSERLRAEAEVRRAELELKRTEIISKTQLQIAKLFVKKLRNQNSNSGSSSLRAEPNATAEIEEKNG